MIDMDNNLENELDALLAGGGAARPAPLPVVEVYNVWAVYSPTKPKENPLAELGRPQDWGDPRWHLEQFRFEWVTGGVAGKPTRYLNHVSCWTDAKMETWRYPQYFASLIVQICMPGSPPELCGREFLDADDFWQKAWGPRPPFYQRPEEDYE